MSQMYIVENRNIIKVTKNVSFNNKAGKYELISHKDTIGFGDFESTSIPSDYLRAAVDTGYVGYVDTITKKPSNFFKNLFFKDKFKRIQVISRHGNSDDFEVDRAIVFIGSDIKDRPIVITGVFLFFLIMFLLGGFSKKNKSKNKKIFK